MRGSLTFRLLRRGLSSPDRAAGASSPLRRAALTRRQLVVAGTAAAASACMPGLLASGGSRIAVIGAGLAGLSAAHALTKSGADVTVFEAANRTGGRVQTVAAPFAPELRLDLGGSFINSDHEALIGLAREFGLPLFDRGTRETEGVASEAFFLETRWRDEAEVAAALAPLAAAVAEDAAQLDLCWDRTGRMTDRLSVIDYLHERCRPALPGWAQSLVEAAIRSEFGCEPGDVSALELIWLAPTVDGQHVRLMGSSDEAFRLADGSEALASSLRDSLKMPVRQASRVYRLRARTGGQIEVHETRGGREQFDGAVVALPWPALREVSFEVPLPDGFRAFLGAGRLGRNEKVFGGFAGRPWREAGRFTQSAWTDLGFTAAWDATDRQPDEGNAALAFFLGAGETRAIDGAGDAGTLLGGQRYRLASGVPGLEEAALPGALVTNWSQRPTIGGSYSSFAPGVYTQFYRYLWTETEGQPAGPAFGNIAFAGEQFSDDFYGFMNGAVESGIFAAKALTG